MSQFKFLDFITEGKMIRNSDGVSRLTFTDASDLVLLYFLALHVMRHYPSRRFAKLYSEQVLKWQNWNNFRSSANDLHCLLNIIDGDERIVEKLKDSRSAKMLRKRFTFPTLTAKRLLRSYTNSNPSYADANDLLKIDNGLSNSRYSGLRRRIANYGKLTPTEKRKAVTELEMALKARGRNSDIVDYYVLFVKDYDLESSQVRDTEPTVSVSDPVQADTKDIQMLRLLGVPNKDLPFAYKVLSMASRGLGIPPRFAQAYAPVMRIVNDIIKAGPGYVNLLKQVHNRAKLAKR
jgi:hypothetical protein|tara:strand:+ start:907 stop:1782 length:876 start_codon:yes stop_codon:yes gene_type:complete